MRLYKAYRRPTEVNPANWIDSQLQALCELRSNTASVPPIVSVQGFRLMKLFETRLQRGITGAVDLCSMSRLQ